MCAWNAVCLPILRMPFSAMALAQKSSLRGARSSGAAIILRVLSMMQRMLASAMRSERLLSCGAPK